MYNCELTKSPLHCLFNACCAYQNLYLYHTIENTANYNTGKALYVLEGIALGLPSVHFAYVALIVLAIVFSMTWYKIVVQHSLVVYHGISYLSLVLS